MLKLTIGYPNVLIGGLSAARVGDMAVCVGPPDVIVQGSSTVFIGGQMAARMGDMTAHGGVIMMGCPTVQIGISPQAAALKLAAQVGAPFVERCGL